MSPPSFNPQITLGNVLSIITTVLAVGASAVGVVLYVGGIDARTRLIEERVARHSEDIRQLAERDRGRIREEMEVRDQLGTIKADIRLIRQILETTKEK